jgi:hypothetical protein
MSNYTLLAMLFIFCTAFGILLGGEQAKVLVTLAATVIAIVTIQVSYVLTLVWLALAK